MTRPPAERPNLPPGLPPGMEAEVTSHWRPPEPPLPASPRDYRKLKVSELKDHLSIRGLPTHGKKDELVARLELLSRLETADAANLPPSNPEPIETETSAAEPEDAASVASSSSGVGHLVTVTSATSRVVLIEALKACSGPRPAPGLPAALPVDPTSPPHT